MPYLIDGHNLIGQTPGLALDDPDDEVKLVLLVRRHCLREGRKATVIFDGGLPGGVSNLSTSDVTVIFASDRHTTADDLIINRLNSEKNPPGLILVTSDHKIVSVAQHRRISVLSSAEFGRALTHTPASSGAPEKERGLTQQELADWEKLFKQGKSG